MPQGIQHRVVLVGVEQALEPAIRAALSQRAVESVTVHEDVPSAVADALARPGVAHLFIVQLSSAGIAALTSTLPGQPVLALLPEGASVAQVVDAQRAGAAQIVPLPFVIEDALKALDGIALLFPPPTREAQVLAVCGVSGGCGGTTIALNLAWELGRPELMPGRGRQSCLLVELARQMGSLAMYLNVEPPRTTQELLADPARLTTHSVRQALTTIAPGLDVLVGPYQDITPGIVSPRHVYQLLQLCRRLASIVVLDVPCAFDDLLFETLALADQVVLVGTQTVASVRTMKLVRDTLEREEGIQGMRLVINRYEPSLPSFNAERLAELLQVPSVQTVANDYPAVMSAVTHGKPLGLAMPHSRVLSDIRSLARSLIGASSPAPISPSVDRLARALGRPDTPAVRTVRVLHIEDDPVQQQAMQLHLAAMKEFAFVVTPAVSEEEAVAVFRREGFDVVLLDYHLAQGDGLECLRQLRAIDPIVPVVVISGVAQPNVAFDLIAAGADDFLSKENFSAQTLVRSLSAAVDRVDAIKQRLPDSPQDTVNVDAFFDRMRRTAGVSDEAEFLKGLRELHESAVPRQFTAGQIQRLVDLVCSELDRQGGGDVAKSAMPRRAMLALFMRLFGGQG